MDNLDKFYKKVNTDLVKCMFTGKYSYTKTDKKIYVTANVKKDFYGCVLFCIPREKFFINLNEKHSIKNLDIRGQMENTTKGILHEQKNTLKDKRSVRCIHDEGKENCVIVNEKFYNYFHDLDNVTFEFANKHILKILSCDEEVGIILGIMTDKFIYDFFSIQKSDTTI